MKRIKPGVDYLGLPCSAVAVGCALHGRIDLKSLISDKLRNEGYLSLKEMNTLIRANMPVVRHYTFRRGGRPTLEEFTKDFKGKAIICVYGHFLYLEDDTYYSFWNNDKDQVVSVWEL